MASIYELTGEFLQFSIIADQEELTEEQKVMLDEALCNLCEDIEVKLEGYSKVIRNIEADIEGIRAEEKRLASRRKAMENRIESLKSAMAYAMKATDTKKVKGDLFTISIQANPESVVIDEQYLENIPPKYLIPQEPKIDKKLLKEDIKAGVDLDGIAHLEQSEGIRIR